MSDEPTPIREHRFPVLKLSGGPLGKGSKLEIDGEEVRGVTRLEVVADVQDLVKATVTYLVTADLEIKVSKVATQYAVAVRQPVTERHDDNGAIQIESWEVIAQGVGDTLRKALLDAAHSIEEE